MTPKLASLLFISLWTVLVAASGIWSWRCWRRSRETRIIKTWLIEVEETDFPTCFAALGASTLLGVAAATALALVGIGMFVSMLGN